MTSAHRPDDVSPRATDERATGKKPFESPRLSVYGNIATLTQTVNPTGPNNDGGSGKTKTAV
jgi:hypothetical protein